MLISVIILFTVGNLLCGFAQSAVWLVSVTKYMLLCVHDQRNAYDAFAITVHCACN